MSDGAKQDAPRATAAAEAFIAALWDKRSTVGEIHESARALVNEAFALERELAAANEAREKAEREMAITRSCALSPNPFPNGMNDHMPEFFAMPEVTENLAKAHPVLIVRNCANEILRLRAELAAANDARDQAKVDLASREQDAWHAGYDFAKLHFYDIPLRNRDEMFSHLAGALKDRAALRADVERLREDEERLSWYESNQNRVIYAWGTGDWIGIDSNGDAHQSKSIRTAIDAARNGPSRAGWYLQDARSMSGNCMMWWRQGGSGYTSDLGEAHVFTDEEAARGALRATDVFWPKAYIDERARLRVDFQVVRLTEALANGGQSNDEATEPGGTGRTDGKESDR